VTKEEQIVLDPFAGSGTTLLAAKELNRHFIGYEKNNGIYNIAVNRLGIEKNNSFYNKEKNK
ncbi:DNA methyltransferase, partial [Haemophilus influenzae]